MNKLLKKLCLFAIIVTMITGFAGIAMAAGWEQVDGGWYYRGNNGEYLKNTWVYSNEKNYYVGADGKMLTGAQDVVYRSCLFDESGAFFADSDPIVDTGLNYDDLCTAQQLVRQYWGAIKKGYEMINEQRAANGVAPIMLNYDLCVAAAYRCIEMEKYSSEQNGPFYSGPDANGQMLWNTVPQALTGNAAYVGTENKSFAIKQGGQLSQDGINDMIWLLNDQFHSEAHYAQLIGQEYTQIGIAIYYSDSQGSYRIAEEIKIGE